MRKEPVQRIYPGMRRAKPAIESASHRIMMMKETGHLQINLLGRPEVWLDGERLSHFSTAKTEALLYYLAATQQIHSRETLAGLLWADMPDALARRNLTKSLTVLRRLLQPFLLIEPQRVGFDPVVAVELDVALWATAVSTTPPSPNLLHLYRGDFLDGFFVKDAPDFEEWQLTRREQLREEAIAALSTLTTQAANQREYASGLAYGRRLLELDPWRESAHRQVMLLLVRHGQHTAALAQYEQCRQLLAEGLGVEPMPETTALFERLQLVRQNRPYLLPSPATPLVGRANELATISERLADPGCRLLTLVGLGGMGKTRLALAAARQANRERAWQFLHGVLFVPLTDVATPQLLPTAISDALDLPLIGHQDPTDQLSHFLQDKEMLLVLDNFEHLLAGTAVLHHLLQTCPDLKFLVTSREPLQLEAEHRFDIGGLSFPVNGEQYSVIGNQITNPPITVREAVAKRHYRILNTEYPAVQLFQQAARQVRPQFELTPENVPDVVRICRVLSGIPLAIRLAAAWLRLLTCAEIGDQIERGLDLLTTTMRDVPPRQRSMTAVFDHSWTMLNAAEQACLAGLSVFRDGFTGQAAQAVVGAALPTLAGLVDRALLHVRETPQGARYHLHELTRQYTAEKLEQSGETAVTFHTAHTHYYAHQLEALTPDLSGKTPKPAFDTIHQEIGNVRRAWQQATYQLDLANLTRMLAPLTEFYTRQGWFSEGQEQLAATISAVQGLARRDKTAVRLLGNLLARQGSLMGRIGQFEPAEAALRQSIDRARQVADPHLLAFALLELGALLRDQSRFAEAAQFIQESLEIATELNDLPLIAMATEKLGAITWDQGSHQAARVRLTEALAQFRQQQDTRRMATTLNSLGNVLMSMGNDRAALAHYQEALPIVRELEDWLMLDTVLINLGMVNTSLGNYEQTRRYYEESMAICRRIGDEVGVAYCLTGLGQADLGEGNLAQARQFFTQSLARNQEMARDRYVAINLNLLGDVAVAEKDWPTACAHFEESRAISERIVHPWGVASSHLRLGDVAVAQGNETAASRHYLAALALGQEMEAPVFVLTALANLAGQLLKRGEAETGVFVLQLVAQQPDISDSLRQTVTELLAQETAVLPPSQFEEVQAKAEQETLETAVACVQALF